MTPTLPPNSCEPHKEGGLDRWRDSRGFATAVQHIVLYYFHIQGSWLEGLVIKDSCTFATETRINLSMQRLHVWQLSSIKSCSPIRLPMLV